ncbi:DUF481 domain-containing protein [Maricaulis maris]|uniref:Putative salt-induced outer membrane protein YdiY n=1 Tax=Maricaulis maris TaxID=74318 RepID=A0A495DMS6_9PROT|nr:DUF481 domain-containing protein [Maricaulis maris]RKR03950.1 putative salt-induced outer membrane protein YdiY [Maricaulis maris]
MRYLIALLIAAASGLFPVAHADLSEDYRTLIRAADRQQSDGDFRKTVELIADVAEGGEAEVLAAIADIAPRREALLADWREPVPDAAMTQASAAMAPPLSDDAVIRLDPAPAEPGPEGWSPVGKLAEAMAWIEPEEWSGRARFGVTIDSGNTEQTDYNFAVELDRELEGGWGLDSKFAYHFTRNGEAVTRDNWLVEMRGERNVIDAWGYYVGGTYEQDRLSGYQHVAFATAGALHQPFDSDGLAWDLRAGPGMRYRQPDDGDAETDWIFEMGSILNFALSEATDFASETTMLAGPASRADQRFALTTAIAGDWGMELAYRIKHEFEPQPGSEATDSHLNVSIVRDF